MSRNSFLLRAKNTILVRFLIPWAVWITQILLKIFLLTQKVLRYQTHVCRPLFQCTFLNSLGDGTLLSVSKKMAARKHREIHGVLQPKKMVPLITREVIFGKHFGKLFFGVNIFDLDFRVQLPLSNNQSSATLWVLDTCLSVGLLPLMIILITASFFKTKN